MKNFRWVMFNFNWYNEYSANTRIHDYFCIMFNQFPVIVFRKIDNPHSENVNMDAILLIGFFGFTWYKKLNKSNANR